MQLAYCAFFFLKAGDTYYFFMHCRTFSHQRAAFFDDVNAIDLEILKISGSDVVRVSLFRVSSRSISHTKTEPYLYIYICVIYIYIYYAYVYIYIYIHI